jgi:hypothetical protein
MGLIDATSNDGLGCANTIPAASRSDAMQQVIIL